MSVHIDSSDKIHLYAYTHRKTNLFHFKVFFYLQVELRHNWRLSHAKERKYNIEYR